MKIVRERFVDTMLQMSVMEFLQNHIKSLAQIKNVNKSNALGFSRSFSEFSRHWFTVKSSRISMFRIPSVLSVRNFTFSLCGKVSR